MITPTINVVEEEDVGEARLFLQLGYTSQT